MKPVIFEVWGQCDRCRDAFSVYLHQRRYRDDVDYLVEPSPHLQVVTHHHQPSRPTTTIHHAHNACGGNIHLFGALPTTIPSPSTPTTAPGL